MAGEIALDSTIAIRFLNGDAVVVTKVTSQPIVILPIPVVGELLFGAENSARPVENLSRYLQFIQACSIVPMGQETAVHYSRTRHALKLKGRPIPENDIWIAAQCLEHDWVLVTHDRHFSYVNNLVVEQW
jgi:tRNA(fMet)-specific endonuclease VapC